MACELHLTLAINQSQPLWLLDDPTSGYSVDACSISEDPATYTTPPGSPTCDLSMLTIPELLTSPECQQPVRTNRPMNGFMIWAKGMRKVVANQPKYQGLPNNELSVVLGMIWRSLPQKTRNQFNEMAQALRDIQQEESQAQEQPKSIENQTPKEMAALTRHSSIRANRRNSNSDSSKSITCEASERRPQAFIKKSRSRSISSSPYGHRPYASVRHCRSDSALDKDGFLTYMTAYPAAYETAYGQAVAGPLLLTADPQDIFLPHFDIFAPLLGPTDLFGTAQDEPLSLLHPTNLIPSCSHLQPPSSWMSVQGSLGTSVDMHHSTGSTQCTQNNHYKPCATDQLTMSREGALWEELDDLPLMDRDFDDTNFDDLTALLEACW